MNGKELIAVRDRLSREKGIDKALIIGTDSFNGMVFGPVRMSEGQNHER